ncbi:hypothetical protein BKE30_02105 [Alkanindiges hydrocarboniclasticus]|uniref:Uncharacterized protein n=1 Tax=Alkanindiges hydrocarboniclasticus TaxID=1907941 RepID=A0A1S8CYL0_9GAMM|nr:hypothetical protein [Alkanindiges hydrocarboniclasticus]ONG41901.1 hypothetical protein BKE30_02105 [Alkanindiges hydrocarboniclasticus]
MTHPKAEQLLQAQLRYILMQLQSEQTVSNEVNTLVAHLSDKPIEQLITLEHLQALLGKQALDYPVQVHLTEQIVSQIQFALTHASNDSIKIADLIPADSVETVAQYLSSQKDHREAFIHRIFSNPAYAQMLSQTISHAINDYMENNVIAKKMPGMGSLMKMGKSVLEKATDSNLDSALQGYLSKNINNLIAVSEKMANRHLNDQQVYQLIKQGWQSVAQQPVSMVNNYVDNEGLNSGAQVISRTWDSLRSSDYIRTQVNDGIAHWYSQNKQHTLGKILRDVNVDAALIEQELKLAIMPVVRQLVEEGYVAQRVEARLRDFYQTSEVAAIFAD